MAGTTRCATTWTLARAAVDGGAQAIFVHGRTRDARYRRAADWDAIGEVVAAVPVPVVGNGDLLFPHEIEAARARAGMCRRDDRPAARSSSRGSSARRRGLSGAHPPTSGSRIYRRYVALALEHWRDDERGRANVRDFTIWHLNFWCRYAPRHADGSWPTMQARGNADWAQTPLDRLLGADRRRRRTRGSPSDWSRATTSTQTPRLPVQQDEREFAEAEG